MSKPIFGKFSSRHVAALAEIAIDADHVIDSRLAGIQVEPCADGGVVLVASNRVLLVWVNDPKGQANQSFVLDHCMGFIKACREPAGRTYIDCNGDEVDALAPDWMRPGEIMVVTSEDPSPMSKFQTAPPPKGVCVTTVSPIERPPQISESDYDEFGASLFVGHRHFGKTQTIERPLIPWGKVVPSGPQAAIDSVWLTGKYMDQLLEFGSSMRFRFYGEARPIIVDFFGDEHVHAVIMPCDPSKFDVAADGSAVADV